MTELIVKEWLSDCASLSPTEIHSFATSLGHNQEVVRALHTVLEERSKYPELTDSVCTQLFSFYRSREGELMRFTLQFLPTLIFMYLNSVAHGDKKSCRSVETLLIGLYNLEVIDDSGQPKVISFRLPSLAQASIYHEPMSLAHASLTENALRRLEECDSKLVSWGPLPQVESLNAQNRIRVMTALIFVYNKHLSLLPKQALEQLCKVVSKLVTQGFNKPGHHKRSSYGSDPSFVPRLLPRIPISSQFLLECLHAVYFAITAEQLSLNQPELPVPAKNTKLSSMITLRSKSSSTLEPTSSSSTSRFNDFGYLGTQALEDIYNHACYEMYADVILVTSAIRNSLRVNPSGQPCDGPMGISVALSPATTTVTVSKSMITNASFRTKKLPDDIPIQNPKDDAGNEGKNLGAIAEENEEEGKFASRGSSGRKEKLTPKLPSIPGLGKKKDREGSGRGGKNGEKSKDGDKKDKKESKKKDVVVVMNGDGTRTNVIQEDEVEMCSLDGLGSLSEKNERGRSDDLNDSMTELQNSIDVVSLDDSTHRKILHDSVANSTRSQPQISTA